MEPRAPGTQRLRMRRSGTGRTQEQRAPSKHGTSLSMALRSAGTRSDVAGWPVVGCSAPPPPLPSSSAAAPRRPLGPPAARHLRLFAAHAVAMATSNAPPGPGPSCSYRSSASPGPRAPGHLPRSPLESRLQENGNQSFPPPSPSCRSF
ncbi:zyxin-like [Equus caballus]|uniref:zyxin-like n=1 Tax=Equus caballus TaxID=9796 RepID=UPI0038B3EC85